MTSYYRGNSGWKFPGCTRRKSLELLDKIGRALKGREDHDNVFRFGATELVPGFADIAILLTQGDGIADLVLSDVIVPNIGSAEFEQRVREVRPDLPILYMSGYSRQDVTERA